MASQVFADSRRRAYNQAVSMIEGDGTQYVVNDVQKSLVTGLNNIRMAQSYIWSEIPINPSTSQYVLNVIDQQYNVGNNGLLPEERRVKQQDVFFTYAVGFFIRMRNGWQNLNYQLMTYPSAMAGGVAPSFFPDVATLVGLWTTGSLNVTVGGDILTPAWDLGQHLVINQSQTQSGRIPPIYYDQVNEAEDGFAIAEPNWIINGGNNNIYQVNYPNDFGGIFGGVNAASINQGIFVNLVMKCYGFLAQNASSIMNNAPAGKAKK